jgi:hypothetical protein
VFAVRDPFSSRAFRAAFRDPPETEDLVRVLRGERPAPSFEFFRESGKELQGVVWTTYAFYFLLEEGVIAAFHDAGLSGWTSYAVRLENEPDAKYHGLAVQGRCGPINRTNAEIEMRQFPGGLYPVRRGLSFEPSSWDGSDVFMPDDDSAWVLLSIKGAHAIRDAHVRNIDVVPVADIELSADIEL